MDAGQGVQVVEPAFEAMDPTGQGMQSLRVLGTGAPAAPLKGKKEGGSRSKEQYGDANAQEVRRGKSKGQGRGT